MKTDARPKPLCNTTGEPIVLCKDWKDLTCEPNEYEPTMESGMQRCNRCGAYRHYQRERSHAQRQTVSTQTQIAMEQLKIAEASGDPYFFTLATSNVMKAVCDEYSHHMKERESKAIAEQERRHAQRHGEG